MPEPSTPEACNLRREAQVLIEQAVVQQAEISVSRIRNQSSARDGSGAHDQEAFVHAGGTVGWQRTRAGRLSGSGSSTRAAWPKMVMLATF
jgi:hypothetical protein